MREGKADQIWGRRWDLLGGRNPRDPGKRKGFGRMGCDLKKRKLNSDPQRMETRVEGGLELQTIKLEEIECGRLREGDLRGGA